MKNYIIIDFGAINLRIYKKNSGIIFSEPNFLLSKSINGIETPVCFCQDAKQQEGKGVEGERTIYPINKGVIIDKEAQKNILEYALNKCGFSYYQYKSIYAVIPVSCGILKQDLDVFRKLLWSMGLKNIYFLFQPICVSKLIISNQPQLIVDIGYDKTEIALIYNNEILKGVRLDIGGKLLNLGAKELLKIDRNILASNNALETIKTTIGSLFATDNSNCNILAQDKKTLIAQNYKIFAKDINASFIECHDKIVQLIQAFLADCTPEIITSITDSGIVICGNSAKLFGIKKFYEDKLHLKVKILENYGNSVVDGANFFLKDFKNIALYSID